MTPTPRLSSNDRAPLFAEGAAGTLKLAVYLMLAAVAMVADYRGHYVEQVRGLAGALAGPVYWLAAAPVRLVRAGYGAAHDRTALREENQGLRERIMLAEARLSRLAAVQDENARLRTLLDARTRLGLRAQLGELIDVDLDPFRHRLLIGLGANDGLAPGQAVMDAHGVLGQVLEVGRERSVLVLITDASHALPVRVVRTGLRTIAYGTGDSGTLRLPHIPFRADVRPGDALVTSGLGGHFPAGLPVGVVREVTPDDVGTFALALASPSAGLARSGEVLVLHDARESVPARAAPQPELEGPPESMPVAMPEAGAGESLAGGAPR